jgi:dTDP-4-dehydrorhamnose reductase
VDTGYCGSEDVLHVKIVVAGGRGMLGTDLAAVCRAGGVEVVCRDLPELDICDPDSIAGALEPCDWLVNCAAYTAVDRAESEPDRAMAINRDGAAHLAAWCRRQGAKMLQLSTDYVFDGETEKPYMEDDVPSPLNQYGRTKLESERVVQASGVEHLTIRTQSLFGPGGKNFVEAIRAQLDQSDTPLRVVNDQVSSPTYTRHLARSILRLLEAGNRGIVHVSAGGCCSWYEFAVAIVRSAGANRDVIPVSGSEFPRPARRPRYSVLATDRFEAWTGMTMPSWEEGLRDYLLATPTENKEST